MTPVRIGAMKQITVEEECGSWFHLTLDQFQICKGQLYTIDIRACLIARFAVIDSAHVMRALNNL